jgi:alkylation response protein AidB-like acyl-CoA dehydrogenase
MASSRGNPLLDDRTVEFILYELLDIEALCDLPDFGEHNRHTFDLLLTSARTLARRVLFPDYRTIDAAPPVLRDGRVYVHPLLKAAWPQLVDLGLIAATRGPEVGGSQLPLCVASLAAAYLMAGNLSAYGFLGLTSGAAHLLEAFGSSELKARFMAPLYAGEWTGAMALTEPQAGSSLADIRTRATPSGDGQHYLLQGDKVFISAAAHDLAPNVVQMVLARIDGAPPGTAGVSLFVVPNLRHQDDELVDNDVAVTGLVHKIGWRGLPSCVLSFGERKDCHGWLVGEPNRGLAQMFQMMNEARIMVGLNGVATASVAYQEALAYARERTQGRPAGVRDPSSPQVSLLAHADVRRMLLRQKAIVEGGLALLTSTARSADVSAHATDVEQRRRSRLLLDLLTPVAKSFPAEAGFEATVLSLQVHGGYGYSSEFLSEAWMRDQKLNSLHEGTTGIQGLDLLGRKAVADGGAALHVFSEEVGRSLAAARASGLPPTWAEHLAEALAELVDTTTALAGRGAAGDTEGMLAHSSDYLTLFSIVAVGWQWLSMAAVAQKALSHGPKEEDMGFYKGKLAAAEYWMVTELPRVTALAALCRSAESSYTGMAPDWF